MAITKEVLFPYIPALVNRLEKWLTKMSLNGWHLIDVTGWKFRFIKARPTSKYYFSYAFFDLSKGISYDVCRAKTKYSSNRCKFKDKGITLFEVDITKIDDDFESFIRLRNYYYKIHYLKLSIFVFSLCMANLIVSLYTHMLWPLFLVCSCILVYSLISLCVISYDSIIMKRR